MSTASAKPPIPAPQLETIARDACNAVLASASAYDHVNAAEWNSGIVNSILQSMASTSTIADTKVQYKYAVNSTIIQHLNSTSATADAGTGIETPGTTPEPTAEGEGSATAASASVEPQSGRRGMHSATGAYWNNDTDGMWSFKWEGGEKHGLDVVVMIIWVSV